MNVPAENDTAADWRSTAASKSDRSGGKSTTFDLHPPDDREFWTRLSRLASEAAGRCGRRNERRKARWFTRQAALALEWATHADLTSRWPLPKSRNLPSIARGLSDS
jgi:hypothetical protein